MTRRDLAAMPILALAVLVGSGSCSPTIAATKPSVSDRELVRRAQVGDQEAQAELGRRIAQRRAESGDASPSDPSESPRNGTAFIHVPSFGARSQPSLIAVQVPGDGGSSPRSPSGLTLPTTPHLYAEESHPADAELPQLVDALVAMLGKAAGESPSPGVVALRLLAVDGISAQPEDRFPSRIDRVTWACTQPHDVIKRLAVERFCAGNADRYEEVALYGFLMGHTITERIGAAGTTRFLERFTRFDLTALESRLASAGYRRVEPPIERLTEADFLSPANIAFERGSGDPVIVAHLQAGPDRKSGAAIFNLQLFYPWQKPQVP